MVGGFGWGFLCGGVDGGAMVVESLMKILRLRSHRAGALEGPGGEGLAGATIEVLCGVIWWGNLCFWRGLCCC